MGDTDGTALGDGERPRLDGGGHLQLVVSPDDGLDQFLPVAAATEEEHEAEGPDEVGTEEHQTIGTRGRAVAVEHLSGLSPEEVPQPAIDGDGALGEVAVGDVLDAAVGIDGAPHVALHLPAEVENDDREGVVHPEQAEEHVVPGRHLTGTATAGAVAGEAEAQVRLVGNEAGAARVEHTLQQDQHGDVDREGVDVVDHEVGRSQGDRRGGHLAAHGDDGAVEHLAHTGQRIGSGGTGGSGMQTLDPLREDGLQLDRGVAEHVLGTTQGSHRVVVDVEPEAVEAQEDAHPVEVADQGITGLEHPIEHVVDVLGRVVVADECDGRMGTGADDQEAADPHVVGEQRQLGRVVDTDVGIRRHRIHVVRHDDRERTEQRQVETQLGVPGGGQEFVEPIVTVGRGEQQGITLLALENFLDAVADAPVGAVHVARHDEQHRDRQVVMGDVGHPEAAGHRIQPTLEGEEVAVGGPVAGEEGGDPRAEAGEQLGQQILVEELVGEGDVGHRGDGLAVEHQRVAGVDGIHQLGGGQRHVQQVTCPGQGPEPEQTGQVVVEHRLNVLEPLQLRSCLVVVEDTGIEHEAGHHQGTDGGAEELELAGETPGSPHMEEAGGDLDAVEAGTHIAIEDLLAEDRPDHLGTGLDVERVGQPAGVVGEAGPVIEGAAQPDEDDGQMAEVSAEDLPGDLFEIARVAVEIVSVGVEVPNPGGGFGTFGEGPIEVSGLAEHRGVGRNGVPVDHVLRRFPTLWWADGHRDVPRGTGSRWRSTPSTDRGGQVWRPTRLHRWAPWPGDPGHGHQPRRGEKPLPRLELWAPKGDRWRKYRGRKQGDSGASNKGLIPALSRLRLRSDQRLSTS